mmetsp:Transcript_107318/g.300517  ORF Transcript_107318/g.300517 Transcript_107318/m.300517 type:complete len:203 (+) Transcript_107318:1561-2169(+)
MGRLRRRRGERGARGHGSRRPWAHTPLPPSRPADPAGAAAAADAGASAAASASLGEASASGGGAASLPAGRDPAHTGPRCSHAGTAAAQPPRATGRGAPAARGHHRWRHGEAVMPSPPRGGESRRSSGCQLRSNRSPRTRPCREIGRRASPICVWSPAATQALLAAKRRARPRRRATLAPTSLCLEMAARLRPLCRCVGAQV